MINNSIPFNKKKFEQVLHYIISKVGNNIGKTVLFKILYFSDFDFYELNEIPITGETYVKLPFGPAPKNFDKTMFKLKKEKKIEEIKIHYGSVTQIKFISLCDPKLEDLNAEEIKIINNSIQKLSPMSAKQVSAYSHEDIPWKATKDMKNIDYELVFYRNPTFSVKEENNVAC
jgi:uncharacterized phage-associated protein